ncbi:late embryogenesis abundant protein ECP63 [Trifolium repens]|nr:late embryogenesis abundant protein ECP63 [Trifolium repens]
MASRKVYKEDRAEAAAKLAAKDIGDINRTNEREEGYSLNSETQFKQARAEAAAKLAAKDLEDVNRAKESAFNATSATGYYQQEEKPGVIGSVGSMFKAAKDAVVGKSYEAGEKAKDTTDYAAQKTKENADYAAERAREAKDTTANKAGEYTNYAAEKAKEAKDATVQKAGEYKDYAAEKAKEAKDATLQKAGEAKDATMNKAGEYKDYTAEKAKEGKDTTVGKLGEFKDSVMGFFTGKKDETKEMLGGTEEDAARMRMDDLRMGGRGGMGREKVVVKVDESRPGVVADGLRAAAGLDQGDTGHLEEEGTIHVERRREKM